MERILVVIGLCTCLAQPMHARLYIGLACANIQYRQTHILSTSNTRWGSLRLTPTIPNSVVMQKMLINKHKQQNYVQLSPRDTLADFILLTVYTAISIFCTLSIDKKWLCGRQVCTVVGLSVGYWRLPWDASKIGTVWQAGIFLFPTRYIHTVGWITHKQIVYCKKWSIISGYHSCSSVPPYGKQRMCTQLQPTLTLLVIVDLWKENH